MKKNSFLNLPLKLIILALAISFSITACDDDDNNNDERTFTVTIQNISTSTTLQAGAMPDRTAPLSPGLWAVLSSGSLFSLDQQADLGTERLAEEGMASVKISDIDSKSGVDSHGEFSSTVGADGPIIGAGESVTFTFNADPGDQLQIMTMFGQSNDWFYAFDNGGLDLFNDNDPVSGDVTSHIQLYDAGTELDEMPGLGLTQKPDHPNTIDIGPADPVDAIKVAASRHSTFVIPANNAVIKVTVTSAQ